MTNLSLLRRGVKWRLITPAAGFEGSSSIAYRIARVADRDEHALAVERVGNSVRSHEHARLERLGNGAQEAGRAHVNEGELVPFCELPRERDARSVRRSRSRARENRRHPCGELLRAERLLDVVVGPAAKASATPVSQARAVSSTTSISAVSLPARMARQERGYLERRPDPTDRRVALIALTDRGWEQVGEALKIIAGVEQEWARRLGKRRLQQLRELLTELDAHEIA
jgi:hypothetical protein